MPSMSKELELLVLGVVKQGTVKVYDQLRIMPAGSDIVVKSIQMHDDPVHESKSPARVGLAVKGMTAEQISRGDILCLPNSSYMKAIPAAVGNRQRQQRQYQLVQQYPLQNL